MSDRGPSPAAMTAIACDDSDDSDEQHVDDAADLFFHDDLDYDFRAGY